MKRAPALLPTLRRLGPTLPAALALLGGLSIVPAPVHAYAALEDCFAGPTSPRKAKPPVRKRTVPTAALPDTGLRIDAPDAGQPEAALEAAGTPATARAAGSQATDTASMRKLPIECMPAPVRELRAAPTLPDAMHDPAADTGPQVATRQAADRQASGPLASSPLASGPLASGPLASSPLASGPPAAALQEAVPPGAGPRGEATWLLALGIVVVPLLGRWRRRVPDPAGLRLLTESGRRPRRRRTPTVAKTATAATTPAAVSASARPPAGARRSARPRSPVHPAPAP